MIKGLKPVKVARYLFIDHCAEGYGWTEPTENEVLIGYPFGYYSKDAYPFIEHIVDGKVTVSVNCKDLSSIEFLPEE